MNAIGYMIGDMAASVRYLFRKPRRIPPILHGTAYYFNGRSSVMDIAGRSAERNAELLRRLS